MGYRLENKDKRTVETEIRADVSGDVESNVNREVIASARLRIYARESTNRFGVVTAPLVDLLDWQGLLRDLASLLDDGSAMECTTGLTVGDIEANGEALVKQLGTETAAIQLRGTLEETTVEVLRTLVLTRSEDGDNESDEMVGNDRVTEIAVVPVDVNVPPLFCEVGYEK